MTFDADSQARKLVELAEDRMRATEPLEIGQASCGLVKEWENLDQEQRNATWVAMKKLYVNHTAVEALLSPSLSDGLRRYFSSTPEAIRTKEGVVAGIEFNNGFVADLRLFSRFESSKKVALFGELGKGYSQVDSTNYVWGGQGQTISVGECRTLRPLISRPN